MSHTSTWPVHAYDPRNRAVLWRKPRCSSLLPRLSPRIAARVAAAWATSLSQAVQVFAAMTDYEKQDGVVDVVVAAWSGGSIAGAGLDELQRAASALLDPETPWLLNVAVAQGWYPPPFPTPVAIPRAPFVVSCSSTLKTAAYVFCMAPPECAVVDSVFNGVTGKPSESMASWVGSRIRWLVSGKRIAIQRDGPTSTSGSGNDRVLVSFTAMKPVPVLYGKEDGGFEAVESATGSTDPCVPRV